MQVRSAVGLFAFSGCLLLSADAANAGPKRSNQAQRPEGEAPSGPGSRTSKLEYVAVSPAAFRPIASTKHGHMEDHFNGNDAKFRTATAAVHIPDGATVRELSCFGEWRSGNVGKRIRLQEISMHSNVEKDIASVKVRGGEGIRRLDDAIDGHRVDNFEHAYQLAAVFNTKPSVRGCRIGYSP